MDCVRHHNLRDGVLGFSAIVGVFVVLASITLGFVAGGYYVKAQDHSNSPSDSFGFFARAQRVFSASMADIFGTTQTPLAEIDTAKPGSLFPSQESLGESVAESVDESSSFVVPPASSQKKSASSRKSSVVVASLSNTQSLRQSYEPCPLQASVTKQDSGVVLNEIAWMGSPVRQGQSVTAASAAEWIELANTTEEDIDVSGWQVRLDTGKIHVIFPAGTAVPPGGFLLLERGSDDTVPGAAADVIYSGTFSNSGGYVQLVDARCHLMDEANFVDGWSGGNSKTKQTMQRFHGAWQTSAKAGGTPGAANTAGISLPSVATTTTSTVAVISSPTTTTSTSSLGSSGGGGSPGGGGSAAPSIKTYPKLLITQIQLAGATSTKQEFVELYNPGSDSVDLNGWYMQKKTKSGTSFSSFAPKDLFAGRGIPAHGFFIIAHPSSSVTADIFTDAGASDDNTIILKNPNGDMSDKVGMGEANECEGMCAPNPEDGESIRRKTTTEPTDFIDTDNNEADFESSTCPTPRATSICAAPIIIVATSTDPVASSTATSTPPIQPVPTSTATSTDPTPPSNTSSTPTSTTPVASSTTPTLVITKVQITGFSTDPHPTQKDLVTFCNTGTTEADISGWSLRKKTKTATASDSIKSFSSGTVLTVGSCVTWANSADDFAASIGATFSTTATIANDASIALVDGSGAVTDAVAWGSGHVSPFVEGLAFAQNPDQAGQYLQRKVAGGVYQDTNDNSADFELISVAPS